MSFDDYLAKEHYDKDCDEKTCWRLDVTPVPARLVLHSWRLQDGKEVYPWHYSVLACDLDPRSIAIQEPDDDDNLCYLRVNCLFYRDAITEKRAADPSFLRKTPVIHFPIAKEISDIEAARKSLEDLLGQCGALPAIIHHDSIKDLLNPIREALEPARRVVAHSNDGKSRFKQTVSVAVRENRVLLIVRMERNRGSIRDWIRPEFDLETFELLSTNEKALSTRKSSSEHGEGVWTVTLPSAGRLKANLCQGSSIRGHTLWYVDVRFPGEAEARQFSASVATAVEKIRERLYERHRELRMD